MIEASRGRGSREDPLLSGKRTQGAEACWKKNLSSLGRDHLSLQPQPWARQCAWHRVGTW